MKEHKICWLDVIIGALISSVIWLLIYCMVVVPNYMVTNTTKASTSASTSNEPTVQESVVEYKTGIKDYTLNTTDKKKIKLKTPDKFYSLTDQYLESLEEYYAIELEDFKNFYVVGDKTDPSQCTIMINSATLSDVAKLLPAIYGDEYNEDTHLYSEVCRYMMDGKMPEDIELPDNYALVDLGTITKDGITYHMYDKFYSVAYDIPAGEDSTETKTLNVPSYEFVVYSDNEDKVETIIYMNDYDVQKAYDYFCDFIGAPRGTVPEGTPVVGAMPVFIDPEEESVTEMVESTEEVIIESTETEAVSTEAAAE